MDVVFTCLQQAGEANGWVGKNSMQLSSRDDSSLVNNWLKRHFVQCSLLVKSIQLIVNYVHIIDNDMY